MQQPRIPGLKNMIVCRTNTLKTTLTQSMCKLHYSKLGLYLKHYYL